MEVTDIKVWPYSKEGSNFLGNGSITFDDSVFIKFAINKSPRDGSPWIGWPSKKSTKDDKYYPEAGIVIGDEGDENRFKVKNDIEKQIITEYNKKLGISTKDEDSSRFGNTDDTPSEKEEPKEPTKKKIPLIKLRK